jgi:ApaG protein
METGHSDTTTDGIRIRVAAQIQAVHSDPDRRHFVYAYRVVITNEGTERAKLMRRHWIVRDANGDIREVKGPGVVGEFPDLAPGENFEYVSGCPLQTEWGTMEGSYRMRRPDGTEFEARIGRFFLAPNVAPLASLTDA